MSLESLKDRLAALAAGASPTPPNSPVIPDAIQNALNLKANIIDLNLKANITDLDRKANTADLIAIAVDVSETLRSVTNPLQLAGFIGDGNTHPLSERFTSLDKAKLVYPRALALSEQIDRHAIQLVVDLSNAEDKCVVTLPPGCLALIDAPILSGGKPTLVEGKDSTIIQITPGADGWHHGTAATGYQSGYFRPFRVRGVHFQCLGTGGTAFKVEQHPASGVWIMEDVVVQGRGNQTDNYWSRAGIGTNTTSTTFKNVIAAGKNGGNLTTLQNAWTFNSNREKFPRPNGTFIFRFDHCDIGFYRSAYQFDINLPTEGIWINYGNVNQCMNVMTTTNTFYPEEAYRAPQYYISGLQAECYSTYFNFSGVKYCRVSDCLFIVSSPNTTIAPVADYSWDLFKLSKETYGVLIERNHIELLPGCKPRVILDASGAAADVTMRENQFFINEGAAGLALIDFGASGQGRRNIREYDNTGVYNFNWVLASGDAQRENGNFSETSILRKLILANNGDKLVNINKIDGSVTILSSRVGTPSSDGSLVFSYPSYVFASSPYVIPTLGDYIGSETVIPVATDSSTSSVKVRLFGNTGQGPRRINLSVTG